MYDDSLNDLKAKYSEAQAQNNRLTASLQNLQSGSKETREKLSEEVTIVDGILFILEHNLQYFYYLQ